MLTRPPLHRPKRLLTLDYEFAADPFDPRMHRGSPNREHTVLGLLVEIWAWVQKHPECVPADLVPVFNSIDSLLRREAAETIKELESYVN
jgi:hypothetical protein